VDAVFSTTLVLPFTTVPINSKPSGTLIPAEWGEQDDDDD